MKRLSFLTLIFAGLTLVFGVILVLLRMKFPLYPLVSYQDVFSLLPPLIFIPLYWLLFRQASTKTSLGQEIAFMILSAMWVEGQGMHQSANAIGNLIGALSRNPVISITPAEVHQLTYFFDEHLSHYLMHTGMLGLAALLIYREWRSPASSATVWWAAILAGVLFGFFNFCTFIEGQTVALGLPFCLMVVLFAGIWGRNTLAQRPLSAFYFIACLAALLLLTGWGLRWGGFPQFSEVGMV